MRLLLIISSLLLSTGIARAEMVRNDTIGNDPDKEKLCASRAKGKPVPFEIDSRYVERARSFNPDVTFIAIDGMSPQLVECYLRQGTGKYEPASFSPEQGYWHYCTSARAYYPSVHTCAENWVKVAPRSE